MPNFLRRSWSKGCFLDLLKRVLKWALFRPKKGRNPGLPDVKNTSQNRGPFGGQKWPPLGGSKTAIFGAQWLIPQNFSQGLGKTSFRAQNGGFFDFFEKSAWRPPLLRPKNSCQGLGNQALGCPGPNSVAPTRKFRSGIRIFPINGRKFRRRAFFWRYGVRFGPLFGGPTWSLERTGQRGGQNPPFFGLQGGRDRRPETGGQIWTSKKEGLFKT